jgi:hypothetical protein
MPPPATSHKHFFLFFLFLQCCGLNSDLHLEPLHQLFFCDGFFEIVSHELFVQAGFEL